jgi:outer membrane autotransporter protein
MLLAADFWVSALLRRVEQAGSFAYIAKRGDKSYGSVLIKVVNLRTREAYVLREAQTGEETVWMRPTEAREEADLDAWIARQIKYDSDLWVVEIEDVDGRHFLTEKVEAL